MLGQYREEASDSHCLLRDALLDSGTHLPGVPADVGFTPEEPWPSWSDRMAKEVTANGLAVVRMLEPLPDEEFLALGKALGSAMPELDPATRAHTDRQVILNLRSQEGYTDDVTRQPFAANPLSLHSEGSGRALTDQPRYIVLMCVEPGQDKEAPRTVLVPMVRVTAQLSPDDRRLLAATSYRNGQAVPPIARPEAGSDVYSFRDYQGEPLDWVCTFGDATVAEVNGALGRLLTAMYAFDGASAVNWTRGLLVVIDNTRFFHGRTAGAVRPSARPRHLRRLRIR